MTISKQQGLPFKPWNILYLVLVYLVNVNQTLELPDQFQYF